MGQQLFGDTESSDGKNTGENSGRVVTDEVQPNAESLLHMQSLKALHSRYDFIQMFPPICVKQLPFPSAEFIAPVRAGQQLL